MRYLVHFLASLPPPRFRITMAATAGRVMAVRFFMALVVLHSLVDWGPGYCPLMCGGLIPGDPVFLLPLTFEVIYFLT